MLRDDKNNIQKSVAFLYNKDQKEKNPTYNRLRKIPQNKFNQGGDRHIQGKS